jgi:hypothetical protein
MTFPYGGRESGWMFYLRVKKIVGSAASLLIQDLTGAGLFDCFIQTGPQIYA